MITTSHIRRVVLSVALLSGMATLRTLVSRHAASVRPRTRAAAEASWQPILDRCQPRALELAPPLDVEDDALVARLTLSYLIMVHKASQPWRAVLRAMYSPHDVFLFHLDAAAPSELRAEMIRHAETLPNVFIMPLGESVAGDHFGYSLVQAERRALRWLVDRRGTSPGHPQWDYNVFVGGATLPLYSRRSMLRYLARAKRRGVENLLDLWGAQDTSHRVRAWEEVNLRPWLEQTPQLHVLWRLLLGPDWDWISGYRSYREKPGTLFSRYCVNLQWRILGAAACEHVVAETRANARFHEFFRHTATPDEGWVGNVLMQAPEHENRTASVPLMAQFWTGGGHPQVLPRPAWSDADAMRWIDSERKKGAIFVRKFEFSDGQDPAAAGGGVPPAELGTKARQVASRRFAEMVAAGVQ